MGNCAELDFDSLKNVKYTDMVDRSFLQKVLLKQLVFHPGFQDGILLTSVIFFTIYSIPV